VLAANRADGVAIDNASSNVELGTWNAATKTFTVTSPGTATAVRVTARIGRTGNGIPMTFASILGINSVAPKATAVAAANGGTGFAGVAASTNAYVPATSNPFAAGKPANATIWDMWGGENLAGGMVWTPTGDIPYGSLAATSSGQTVQGGDSFQISATGTASWQLWGTSSYAPLVGPDGDNWYQTGSNPGEFPGISDSNLPGSALIAVFITDAEPSGPKPVGLDFSSPASRDYLTISPQLGQVFFVGDGKTSAGVQQTIVAPPGATRMFLGFADGHCWRDNTGGFTTTVNKMATGIKLVR
jgi:hypothetical protein